MVADEAGDRPDLFRSMFLRYLIIDVVVGLSLATLWLLLYDTPDPVGAVQLSAGLYLLRFLAWVVHLRGSLAPVRAWHEAGGGGEQELRAVEGVLRRLASRITLNLVSGWLAYFLGLTLLAWWVVPDVIRIGQAELLAALLQALSVGLGSALIYLLVSRAMVEDSLVELDEQLRRRELRPSHRREPLARRLILVGIGLACVPSVWYGSMDWLGEVQLSRRVGAAELRADLERGLRRGQLDALDGRTKVERVAARPEGFTGDGGTRVDVRRERVSVAMREPGGRWLVATRDLDFDWVAFIRDFGLMLFIATAWGAITIMTQSRSLLGALARLRRATRRMVEVGDIRAMARVPVIADDEVGDLSRDFNAMLASYGDLATAAERVADGDLAFDLEGRGDLPEAFARMVGQLHELVVRLRETGTGLAYATRELQAATGELERGTAGSQRKLEQLDGGMSSLADSASQIDESGKGVLDNAERTLANADETAAKMRDLGQRILGIGTLLDQIREIAERSDLLALNGSLEATRAGEMGRGFALVAAEMRRLAERVTGIVEDARALVADINGANASTVETTERSRALAEGTAAAARAIAEQTRRQSEDTEQASSHVAEVTEVLAQTTEIMSHARMIAADLDNEASQLELLLAGFEVRGSSAVHES